MARLCSSSGRPSHCSGRRKRVRARDSTGVCRSAVCQLLPPSVLMSTFLILPWPDQARPRISQKPLPCLIGFSGQGEVITELASCTKVNCRARSEEHTSELQSLMRNSYAVFCLKKKKH